MNINLLIEQLITQTLERDIPAFMPEIVICITILVVLLIRLFPYGDKLDSMWPTLIGSGVALWFLANPLREVGYGEIFGGLLVYDSFSVFARGVLLIFLILFCPLTKITGVPGKYESADIYTLFLGGVLGMCLMASANHLLTVFVAVEMASVPSYALAGLFKHRKDSSEASLKYVVYGAGTAGIMLYGISLLAGLTNSAHLPTVALQLSDMLAAGEVGAGEGMVLAIAGLMITVGLAFKLSAVPFHFWCPDVFHGASAEVNAYLSVASKAAALALLVRVAMGLGVVSPWINGPMDMSPPTPAEEVAVSETASGAATQGAATQVAATQLVAYQADEEASAESEQAAEAPAGEVTAAEERSAAIANLAPVRDYMAKLIALLAAITCTFGNLAAYGQTNIKRLLAYSTIAHAGYMMMAVPAAIVLAGYDQAASSSAVAALGLYIAVYLFMNLGAFAVVAFLRNAMGSEEISSYAGLIRRSPGVVICFSLILFSLVGLPPLAGFLGKYAIFASLANGYTVTQGSGETANFLLVLLIIGGINTAISLYYYLRVVKVMTMEPEPADRVPFQFSMISLAGVYLTLITLPTAFLMLSWEWLNSETLTAASRLLQ